jgi:hypothetical protein
MHLNYKQADNKLFSTSLYEFDYIINKKKTIYSNIISIILIKKPILPFNYLYLVYRYILKTYIRLIPAISVVRLQNRS